MKGKKCVEGSTKRQNQRPVCSFLKTDANSMTGMVSEVSVFPIGQLRVTDENKPEGAIVLSEITKMIVSTNYLSYDMNGNRHENILATSTS